MGLLDQLWDETVAGPRPDSGLGKLRKYSSFSPSSSSSASAPATATGAPPAVTRSITIARPPSLFVPSPSGESSCGSSTSSSLPSSPASTPDSPFATVLSSFRKQRDLCMHLIAMPDNFFGVFGAATTPKSDGWRRFRRKPKVSDGPEAAAVGPRSPTVYDWVVISSLDR